MRWLRWHCPPDTGFEIRALAVWGRARYLSVTEAPHNSNFHTWMGKKQFCFFQTAETGNRTPDSGVKGSGANHYPRAPAHLGRVRLVMNSALGAGCSDYIITPTNQPTPPPPLTVSNIVINHIKSVPNIEHTACIFLDIHNSANLFYFRCA